MVRLSRLATPVVLVACMVASPRALPAQARTFPVPAGLEDAVEFWKQIFTRYSFGEVVLFDPMDHGMVYGVVRAADDEHGRALVEKEKARLAAEYDLADQENRIRSQRGAKEHFAEGLRISGRYIGEMKRIFREQGLPEELTYLPLVESSFNIRARSSAGALGMWQFMPETGKKFMRIDDSVDERRDPLASTRAAARLLKENYRLFDNNWPLAITAYNHGTEGIFRGIQAAESDDLVDLIKRYQSATFGFASKNFYAEFLAVVEIATKRNAYFPSLRDHAPLLYREIEISRPAPLQSVLKPAAISHNDFFTWNPALQTDIKAIPAGYRVKLPESKFSAFLAAIRRLSTAPSNKINASSNSNAAKKRLTAPSASQPAPGFSRNTGQPRAKTAATGARTPVKVIH